MQSHLQIAQDYALANDWARALHHLREGLRLAIREQQPQHQLSTIMRAIEETRALQEAV